MHFCLQAQNALESTAFALRLRLGKIFREKLEVQPQGAEMVLDFVNEAARQFGQLSVAVVPGNASSGIAALSVFRHPGSPLLAPDAGWAAADRPGAGEAVARCRPARRRVARGAQPCATA